MREAHAMATCRLPCQQPSTSRAIVSEVWRRKYRVGSRLTARAVPEPPMKRKTLAERAGETTSRSQLPKTGLANARANGYRHASNTSTSSSGSSRPASRGVGLRHVQAARQQAVSAASSVPEPAMEIDEEAEAGVMGKRKGTPIISLAPSNYEKITLRRTRTDGDLRQRYKTIGPRVQHSGSDTSRSASTEGSVSVRSKLSRETSLTLREDGHPIRNDSLNTAFAGLSLTPRNQRKTSDERHKPSLEHIKEAVSPSKIPKFACTPTLRHTQSAQTLQTPSPLKDSPQKNGLRTPKTGKRKPEPLPVFLTKEKLTSVPAWDTKGRLEDMVSNVEQPFGEADAYTKQENLYAMLRTQFASAADSKTALEESLSIYKSRGLFYLDMCFSRAAAC